jgi:hypothetical protein
MRSPAPGADSGGTRLAARLPGAVMGVCAGVVVGRSLTWPSPSSVTRHVPVGSQGEVQCHKGQAERRDHMARGMPLIGQGDIDRRCDEHFVVLEQNFG